MGRLSAQQVGHWLIHNVDTDAGEGLTPLKLQKFLYYAQGWWMAEHGEPLFADDFEAWVHGPVVPTVFQEYKHLRWQAIEPENTTPPIELSDEVEEHLGSVLAAYSEYSAKQLERMTHAEPPWIRARNGLDATVNSAAVISKSSIAAYFAGIKEADGDGGSQEQGE